MKAFCYLEGWSRKWKGVWHSDPWRTDVGLGESGPWVLFLPTEFLIDLHQGSCEIRPSHQQMSCIWWLSVASDRERHELSQSGFSSRDISLPRNAPWLPGHKLRELFVYKTKIVPKRSLWVYSNPHFQRRDDRLNVYATAGRWLFSPGIL